MKVTICTTPIRPAPTDYPPFGAMAIIQALNKAGHQTSFYDIDAFRPPLNEVVRHLLEESPEVVGISAVVSTAYAYTKAFCLAVKKELPGVPIVVGGNLAASAELLHRRCAVDYCVVGEGERVIVNLINALSLNSKKPSIDRLRGIPGLTFLDKNNELVFTGYELPIPPEEMEDPDFSILEKYSKITNFIQDFSIQAELERDPRSHQNHRKGQKGGTVVSTKGCVSRCTFCHRWDKGYRRLSVDTIIRRIRYLKTRYNVGFISFGDENFGSDRNLTNELIEKLKPLDILYRVAGVRVRTVDPDLLRRLKESGCVTLYYGMESGSDRILQVMEKNASAEHNRLAAQWTMEAGLSTIYQLVLGMPGESPDTIEETLNFVKNVTEKLPAPPHRFLSINYIQALPGTPTYEHARENGLIGKTLDDEENYLIKVSDVDASDDTKFINFTNYDRITVQTWRHKILFEAEAHWYRIRGWRRSPSDHDDCDSRCHLTQGYFNLKNLLHYPYFYRFLWPVRGLYFLFYILVKDTVRLSPSENFRGFRDYLFSCFKKRNRTASYLSLRQTQRQSRKLPTTPSEQNMDPLRMGR